MRESAPALECYRSLSKKPEAPTIVGGARENEMSMSGDFLSMKSQKCISLRKLVVSMRQAAVGESIRNRKRKRCVCVYRCFHLRIERVRERKRNRERERARSIWEIDRSIESCFRVGVQAESNSENREEWLSWMMSPGTIEISGPRDSNRASYHPQTSKTHQTRSLCDCVTGDDDITIKAFPVTPPSIPWHKR